MTSRQSDSVAAEQIAELSHLVKWAALGLNSDDVCCACWSLPGFLPLIPLTQKRLLSLVRAPGPR
eukprot:10010559-Alexandrium_andersonii.AAC.1